MRDKIVAGNWKMNGDLQETRDLLNEIKAKSAEIKTDVKVIVAPSYTNLYPAAEILKGTAIGLAAQNMHQNESGAFTGEVSAGMLKSLGVQSVILGHSERRNYFGEDAPLLAKKVDTAIAHGFHILFCLGESLENRESGKHFDIVANQLSESIFHLKNSAWEQLTIAYEPVWAIGTGKTASAEQAQEMHGFIRQKIAEKYDSVTAEVVSILYGGSVKPNNAAEIFSKKDVDGGLIGGASLKADDFLAIVNAC